MIVARIIVMQRRDEADLERVAPAVEQPHRDVAAVRVGAEEELPVPGRARSGCPSGETTSFVLPPTDLSVMWLADGRRVRDVLRVDRRQQAQHHDHQEQRAEGERGLVAPQAPQRQLVRADAGLALDALAPEGLRRLECRRMPGLGAVGSTAISSRGALARPIVLYPVPAYFSCQVLQSFRYVGWNTAEPKSIRSLKNFGTCSEP